jgi:hypothetical protein
MFNATTQIKRTIVLAGALAAVAAPSASARVADAHNVPTPSAAVSRSAEPTAAAPTMADMAARREAIATKAWQAANPSTIVEVSSPDGDGGLDLPSAGIGAAVPLTLVLIEVIGKWVLRRRRENRIQHQLA